MVALDLTVRLAAAGWLIAAPIVVVLFHVSLAPRRREVEDRRRREAVANVRRRRPSRR